MNQLAPFNTKQTEYIKQCQASWLNILEGREKRFKECGQLTCFLSMFRKSSR